jgi:hypothetical protein
MLDKRRFRVRQDFYLEDSAGDRVLLKADGPESDVFAYVPLSDSVTVLIEGRFEYHVSRPVFDSHTEPWEIRQPG